MTISTSLPESHIIGLDQLTPAAASRLLRLFTETDTAAQLTTQLLADSSGCETAQSTEQRDRVACLASTIRELLASRARAGGFRGDP